MSKKSVLKMTALAAVFAASAVPMTAAAEVSGNLGISNFYLWRGLDVSAPAGGAAVFGGAEYSESGFYAGIWGISADGGIGGEYDLYAGYGFEVGEIGIDLSYWSYVYPEQDEPFKVGELVLGLSFKDFALTYYTSAGDDEDGDLSVGDVSYLTLGYSYDKFGILVGTWLDDVIDTDNDGDADSAYTHVDLSYSPVENLTLTLSKVVAGDNDFKQDLLFNVAYEFSF